MKHLILILTFLILPISAICNEFKQIDLTVTIFKNENRMKKAIKQRGKEFNGDIKGFAIFSPNDNKCEVFVLFSERERLFEQILGHEIRHCIYGNFHK